MSVPNALQLGIVRIFARMHQLGLTEPVQVYAKQTVYDGGGKAVGRQDVLLVTLDYYVGQGGGSAAPSQEGLFGGAERVSDSHEIYGPLDTTASLTDANYAERWLVLPNRSTRQYRVAVCQAVGPYLYILAESGGSADAAGGIR